MKFTKLFDINKIRFVILFLSYIVALSVASADFRPPGGYRGANAGSGLPIIDT